ncbi:hypothetical protein K469DRAFT_693527 [Zopfia rhizophila CBS 207.26]|uniref:Uncharacterized protein n=1 Tax=Zopfia rhizophila CBS 207.26 TaxID=1314779 RepID=A0A6A6DQ63_9PEZI|nr:hypothetical protein K469DRAFT_693527 [Zopfia rhizophila CBS 207.26]
MTETWKYYDVDEYKAWKTKQGKDFKSPPRANFLAAATYVKNLLDSKNFNWAAICGLAMLCLGSRREMPDIHIVFDDKDFQRLKRKLEADQRTRLPKGMNALFPTKILLSTGPKYNDFNCPQNADVEVDLVPPGSHGTPPNDALRTNQVLLRWNIDGKMDNFKGLNMLYLIRTTLQYCRSQDLAWDPKKDIVFLCESYGKDIAGIRHQLSQQELHDYFFSTSFFSLLLSVDDQRKCSQALLGTDRPETPKTVPVMSGYAGSFPNQLTSPPLSAHRTSTLPNNIPGHFPSPPTNAHRVSTLPNSSSHNILNAVPSGAPCPSSTSSQPHVQKPPGQVTGAPRQVSVQNVANQSMKPNIVPGNAPRPTSGSMGHSQKLNQSNMMATGPGKIPPPMNVQKPASVSAQGVCPGDPTQPQMARPPMGNAPKPPGQLNSNIAAKPGQGNAPIPIGAQQPGRPNGPPGKPMLSSANAQRPSQPMGAPRPAQPAQSNSPRPVPGSANPQIKPNNVDGWYPPQANPPRPNPQAMGPQNMLNNMGGSAPSKTNPPRPMSGPMNPQQVQSNAGPRPQTTNAPVNTQRPPAQGTAHSHTGRPQQPPVNPNARPQPAPAHMQKPANAPVQPLNLRPQPPAAGLPASLIAGRPSAPPQRLPNAAPQTQPQTQTQPMSQPLNAQRPVYNAFPSPAANPMALGQAQPDPRRNVPGQPQPPAAQKPPGAPTQAPQLPPQKPTPPLSSGLPSSLMAGGGKGPSPANPTQKPTQAPGATTLKAPAPTTAPQSKPQSSVAASKGVTPAPSQPAKKEEPKKEAKKDVPKKEGMSGKEKAVVAGSAVAGAAIVGATAYTTYQWYEGEKKEEGHHTSETVHVTNYDYYEPTVQNHGFYYDSPAGSPKGSDHGDYVQPWQEPVRHSIDYGNEWQAQTSSSVYGTYNPYGEPAPQDSMVAAFGSYQGSEHDIIDHLEQHIDGTVEEIEDHVSDVASEVEEHIEAHVDEQQQQAYDGRGYWQHQQQNYDQSYDDQTYAQDHSQQVEEFGYDGGEDVQGYGGQDQLEDENDDQQQQDWSAGGYSYDGQGYGGYE